ncbi:hypothetical protein WMY93_014868 [Mugilogobius chulae]|uniref:Uncharacterized protein n=1 Tax=Mugilogobius chulae TaxID=88201 RepID=A0AAW0NWR1_9GOBI
MKFILVFVCLLGLSLGASLDRRPKPCKSPPLVTGAFTFSTQNEAAWLYAGFEYDAFQERIRIYETGYYNNKSVTYDFLMHYAEGVVYQINSTAKTCTKSPLAAKWEPMGVPADASLLGQVVVGSSSGPGEGLLVNTWQGIRPDGVQYMLTVTEFGCIPVSYLAKTKEFGWIVLSYFNNVKGILNPGALDPPSFCPSQTAEPQGKPMDFFSILHKMKKILGASLDRRPKPCKVPPQLSGLFMFTTQKEAQLIYAEYAYDAFKERIFLYAVDDNTTMIYYYLMDFAKGVVYYVTDSYKNLTDPKCTVSPLAAKWEPLGVPTNASFWLPYVVGSSSRPGEGVPVNTWYGYRPDGVKYIMTVTENGCIPVTYLAKTKNYGWTIMSFMDNLREVDPRLLEPPSICLTQTAKPQGKPMDFFSILHEMKTNSVQHNKLMKRRNPKPGRWIGDPGVCVWWI